MKQLVLLVEDSKEVYRMVSLALSGLPIQLEWAKTVKESKGLIQGKNFDLLLLDIDLPDGNGIDLCAQILNGSPKVAVFFLTGSSGLSEKVLGFSAGADDYITKPFDQLELRARVEAKLKKLAMLKVASDIFKWEEIEIDKSRQEVRTFESESFKNIDLTGIEFKLLCFFAQRPGLVINRETLLNNIWGENVHVYSRSVDTHVSKLRKKLGSVSHLIESIHGTGYKFSPTNLSPH